MVVVGVMVGAEWCVSLGRRMGGWVGDGEGSGRVMFPQFLSSAGRLGLPQAGTPALGLARPLRAQARHASGRHNHMYYMYASTSLGVFTRRQLQ